MPITTARRTYQMLDNESLWRVAQRVHKTLAGNAIGHAVVGGVAVCLHGYRRNTVDLDLLVLGNDQKQVGAVLKSEGFKWFSTDKEFQSDTGIAVHFVIAGEPAGPRQEAKFPSPSDPKRVTKIEGLPVLTLPELIQAKIACGLGDMRRTYKDFADVVELIAIHRLDGSLARLLHKSVRKEFRELVRRAGGH